VPGSEVAVVPIGLDFRALTKGKADETEENNEADGCNNPIGHVLIRTILSEAAAQPYVDITLYLYQKAAAIRDRFYLFAPRFTSGHTRSPLKQ
jgi:hypothetical protein